jgi:hypothetical protein
LLRRVYDERSHDKSKSFIGQESGQVSAGTIVWPIATSSYCFGDSSLEPGTEKAAGTFVVLVQTQVNLVDVAAGFWLSLDYKWRASNAVCLAACAGNW